MRQAILFSSLIVAVSGTAAFAQQREPFGSYFGLSASHFVTGPESSALDDVTELSAYYGHNFSFAHIELHVDYLTFDATSGEDSAYRVQFAYSPEWISETELALYVARTYDGNIGTDVTEYGFTSNTILTDRTELYVSGGIFDANGEYSVGVSAAVDYAFTDSFVAELALGAYDGSEAVEGLIEYDVNNSPLKLFASGLIDGDGDYAARLGVSLEFGVDRQKFRPRVTPLELGVLF